LEPLRFEKVKSPKQPCFAVEQVELLISNAEGWAVPMLATLAFTGMRLGELQQLRWEDVDLERNVIHVHRGGSGDKPKDKEDRFIPIHAKKLKPMLESLPGKSELTFLMPKDKKVSPKKLRAYLKNLCAVLRIPSSTSCIPSGISLRATVLSRLCPTNMSWNGWDTRQVPFWTCISL
jgi:integrase